MHYTGPMFTPELPIHNCLIEWDDDLPLVDAVTGAKLPNTKFNTSFMGKLIIPESMSESEIYQGMPMRPRFAKDPRGRMLDLWFEPDLPKDFDKYKVEDIKRGMYSNAHGGIVRFK